MKDRNIIKQKNKTLRTLKQKNMEITITIRKLKGLVVVFGDGFCRTVRRARLSWICRDYFFSLFFPLAAKLIGPKMGCQFFKNVDFLTTTPFRCNK